MNCGGFCPHAADPQERHSTQFLIDVTRGRVYNSPGAKKIGRKSSDNAVPSCIPADTGSMIGQTQGEAGSGADGMYRALRITAAAAVCGAFQAGVVKASSHNTSPVVLTCAAASDVAAADGDAACAALADALAVHLTEIAPDRVLHPSTDTSGKALQIDLTVTAAGPHHLAAMLVWQQQDASGKSPPLDISVQDSELRPPVYLSFIGALIREAGLRL